MKTRYILFSTALCSAMGLGLTSCNNDKFVEVNQYEIIAMDAMHENDASLIPVFSVVMTSWQVLRQQRM